jgi:hypothetical protein
MLLTSSNSALINESETKWKDVLVLGSGSIPFLLAWFLLGRHGTPKQQKTHCRAVGLRNRWDITGPLGNPRFEI